MATKIYTIERLARKFLDEPQPRFWSSDEMTEYIVAGIKDLWREITNLEEDHFYTIDETNVSLVAGDDALTGVPSDVHRIKLIEPLSTIDSSANVGLAFKPMDYNHKTFQAARAMDAIDPSNNTIYYAIVAAGAPVGAPTLKVAPATTADVDLRFVYVPTISSTLTSDDNVPIPGEADNALVAWAVAYARAKEREDRSPDPGWLATYVRERDALVNSLGVRQTQEPRFVDALFEEYN